MSHIAESDNRIFIVPNEIKGAPSISILDKASFSLREIPFDLSDFGIDVKCYIYENPYASIDTLTLIQKQSGDDLIISLRKPSEVIIGNHIQQNDCLSQIDDDGSRIVDLHLENRKDNFEISDLGKGAAFLLREPTGYNEGRILRNYESVAKNSNGFNLIETHISYSFNTEHSESSSTSIGYQLKRYTARKNLWDVSEAESYPNLTSTRGLVNPFGSVSLDGDRMLFISTSCEMQSCVSTLNRINPDKSISKLRDLLKWTGYPTGTLGGNDEPPAGMTEGECSFSVSNIINCESRYLKSSEFSYYTFASNDGESYSLIKRKKKVYTIPCTEGYICVSSDKGRIDIFPKDRTRGKLSAIPDI